MKLAPYPSYKPSDVEWLGEVPDIWEAEPRCAWLSRRYAGLVRRTKASMRTGSDGDIRWPTRVR